MLCLPPILLLLELHVLLKPGFEGGGRDGPINAWSKDIAYIASFHSRHIHLILPFYIIV